jgi:hypothetical protein
MEREAARIRGLVEAHRPTGTPNSYPAWLRQEVVRFAVRARPLLRTWADVAAMVALPTTTVLRWVERAGARAAASGASVDESPGTELVVAAVERSPEASPGVPGLGAERRPDGGGPGCMAPSPGPSGADPVSTAKPVEPGPSRSPVVAATVRSGRRGGGPSKQSPHAAVGRKPSGGADSRCAPAPRTLPALAVAAPLVPVPVVTIPDPPWPSGPPGRGGGGTSGGGLWLETPSGFRLWGLDLTSAKALLELLR